MIRRLALAVSLVALLSAALRPPVAHAHTQMFTVSVGRNGFESMVDFTLAVEAGHEVVLTFTYADNDLADDNPHDIRIKGPGTEDLPTVTVSRENPTATLTFIPKKTGLLRVVCIVPCIGMENLVGGQLKVVRPRATGAPTTLNLDLSPRDDGSILARVTLQKGSGEPLGNAPVIFTLRTALGGELVLGSPTTMENGSAVVKIPATGGEQLKVTASFEGGNGLAYAETSGEISAPGAAMEHRPAGLSAPTAPAPLAFGLLIVLGGVWATYGFVVYQVFHIRREKPTLPALTGNGTQINADEHGSD
jgi:hypothetical protein